MKVEHRVREGESLWSIAHRYGVAVSQIAKWNTISAPETLQVDQKLDIWVSADAK
jgi:LysM repeat protein